MTFEFYLGTHRPSWLATADLPLFVSHRTLRDRRTLPVAAQGWALDSGGFTELNLHGEWLTTPSEYVAAVRRYSDEIGQLEWASPQDWMCEPFVLQRTGLTVADHQRLTIDNYLHLRDLAPQLPFVPVLQGWTIPDYLRHADAYQQRGVDLTSERVVGVGSVCRRQDTRTADLLFTALSEQGLRLHGFGVKTTGLRVYAHALRSADSMAWSRGARFEPPLPGCTHKTCANCLLYARLWRDRVLAGLRYQQLTLGGAA